MRTHTCGQLRLADKDKKIALCGWVQCIRDKGGLIWIDLRDRYGVTQLVLEQGVSLDKLLQHARGLGREYVIQVTGRVIKRFARNPKLSTGDIEIQLDSMITLNPAKLPPFLIEDETDGGEELRMKYRYLDLRRNPVKEAIYLRHKLAKATRDYLDEEGFIEVETPVLIKSTPEGARDFLVPSRMNKGQFYALPQSPQTFKQLLMVSGFDKYFQLVKCFRDEDLRADRQPEFTQIDCEMSFITQEELLNTFESLVRYLFKNVKDIYLGEFPRMDYADAMEYYGSDKPHIGFDMKLHRLNKQTKNKGFRVFDEAEVVLGICVKGCSTYTRKQLDELTKWVKRTQIGTKGLVYVKCNEDGSFKSSVDKFYTVDDLKSWAEICQATAGDLLLILSGALTNTRKAMGELRLEMAERLGLCKKDVYYPLWVLNFPLLEKDEATGQFHAMHHPFTSPLPEDREKLCTKPEQVRANAYDMVLNGVELGGGSIRIHDKDLQAEMFKTLGFSKEEAQAQFGFLMDAFEYGAPPHGGIAFGFDRLCALFGNSDSIRDYIAFPKNTSGRDVMIDSPSPVDDEQLKELGL